MERLRCSGTRFVYINYAVFCATEQIVYSQLIYRDVDSRKRLDGLCQHKFAETQSVMCAN